MPSHWPQKMSAIIARIEQDALAGDLYKRREAPVLSHRRIGSERIVEDSDLGLAVCRSAAPAGAAIEIRLEIVPAIRNFAQSFMRVPPCYEVLSWLRAIRALGSYLEDGSVRAFLSTFHDCEANVGDPDDILHVRTADVWMAWYRRTLPTISARMAKSSTHPSSEIARRPDMRRTYQNRRFAPKRTLGLTSI